MNLSRRFQINSSEIATESAEEEVLIIHFESGLYYNLEYSATHIWKLIEQGASIQQIIDTLSQHYVASQSEIEAAVLEFIDALERNRLITDRTDGGPDTISLQNANAKGPFIAPQLNQQTDATQFIVEKPIKVTDVFTVSNDIASERFPDEVVLIHFTTGTYYRLRNASSQLFWDSIQQTVTLGAIVDVMVAHFEGPRIDIEDAVLAFTGQLVKEEILRPDDSQGASTTLNIDAPEKRVPFEAPLLELHTDLQDLLTVDPIHDVDDEGWPNLL